MAAAEEAIHLPSLACVLLCCSQATDLVHAAALEQLAAAERAEADARAALAVQAAALEAALADQASMAQAMEQLQAGVQGCRDVVAGLEADKASLAEALAKASDMASCLQVRTPTQLYGALAMRVPPVGSSVSTCKRMHPDSEETCVCGAVPNAQAEVAAVNAERERLRDSVTRSQERVAALEAELATAKQVHSHSRPRCLLLAYMPCVCAQMCCMPRAS